MKKHNSATASSVAEDSKQFIRAMEAAKSNEELAEVIRAETRRLDAMQNCSIFNQTPFFELIEQMDAAETKLDLTMAVTRLIIALEEHYGLESEAA